MALSPNAPDYVSQVRGVINDLRQNYVQKQQLFQQEQQAQAQIGLGYAQLASQRENQARQASLDEQKIAVQSLQSQRELESLAFSRQRQSASDRLESQKFDLLQEEKNQKMQEIQNKNKEEAESGRIYSLIRDARLSNDPQKIAEAEGQLDNSTLSGVVKSQMLDRLDIAMERKRQVDEKVANQEKRPEANALLVQAANLPLDRMSPEDSSLALNDLEMKFSKLGITDDTNKQFAAVLSQKNAQLAKLSNDVVLGGISQLNADGAAGNVLGPKHQEKYDAIKKQFPNWQDRMDNPDAFNQLRGLAKDIHKDETQKYLEDVKTRFMINQKNLVEKNGNLGIETIDPVTGDKRITFVLAMPNMNLTERDIDPRTGKLLKGKQEEIEDYNRVLNRALAGDINPLQMLLGKTIASAPANPNIKKLEFIPNVPFDTTAATGGIPAGTPGTATVPVSPVQRPTRPSDAQIMAMASDPKTADQLIPGTPKTYRQAAEYLANQNKNSQGKTVANPNTY
jgi:hypothetical protein